MDTTPASERRTASSPRPRRDRFGALELALAIALFSGSAVFAAISRQHGLELTRRGRETDVALMHLSTAMEDLLATPYEDLADIARAGGTLSSGLRPQLEDQRLIARFPGWRPDIDRNVDHCSIVLAYRWKSSNGRERELELRCSKKL